MRKLNHIQIYEGSVFGKILSEDNENIKACRS